MSRLTVQLQLGRIHRVVHQFYLKARQHSVIAHHFQHINDFSSHEEKITAFWWLALGGSATDLVNGAPSIDMINKHLAMAITGRDLAVWLELFKQTLFEELEEDLANAWLAKLNEIANHLKALVIEGKSGGIQITESLKS